MDLCNHLNDVDSQEIEQYARDKLSEYSKLNDVIGTQIFPILERHSRVLYYPLEDEDVWGFVEKTPKDNFVCINTSIDYEKQVFVAAHELYHVIHNACNGELILAKNLEENSLATELISIDELKANRFAAAFLINGDLLHQEMRTLNISKKNFDFKRIFLLSNLFIVPYKTMVRRLYELNLIKCDQMEQFLKVTHQELDIMKKRLGLMSPQQDKSISLDNLVELAMTLHEQGRITIDKLEQELSYSNLTLQDMDIHRSDFIPLTDDEIDNLLEE